MKVSASTIPIDLDAYILSLANGDADALRVIYEAYKSSVYFYALSVLKNEEDAKDVLQDTFVLIRTHAHQYRPKTNPKAWMFRIARNLTIDALRKKQRVVPIADYEELPGANSDIDELLDKNDIYHLLSQLTRDEQEIVTLHIYGGLSHLEISNTLGLPYAMVRWKYTYALRKLRKQIPVDTQQFHLEGGGLHE